MKFKTLSIPKKNLLECFNSCHATAKQYMCKHVRVCVCVCVTS